MSSGGVRKGAGRPKGTTGAYKEIKRNKQITIMLTENEMELLKKCSEILGKTRTSTIVEAIQKLYDSIK